MPLSIYLCQTRNYVITAVDLYQTEETTNHTHFIFVHVVVYDSVRVTDVQGDPN